MRLVRHIQAGARCCIVLAHLAMVASAGCALASPVEASGPLEATPERINDDVRIWIGLVDLDGPHVDPVVYGEGAIPALREVLARTEEYSDYELSRALFLLGMLGLPQPDLVPLIETHLLSEFTPKRSSATLALAAVGREAVGPTLVAQLYDPNHFVRHAALESLGEYGGRDVLQALRIWHHHVSTADADREYPWLTPFTEQRYQEALQRTEQRHHGP